MSRKKLTKEEIHKAFAPDPVYYRIRVVRENEIVTGVSIVCLQYMDEITDYPESEIEWITDKRFDTEVDARVFIDGLIARAIKTYPNQTPTFQQAYYLLELWKQDA